MKCISGHKNFRAFCLVVLMLGVMLSACGVEGVQPTKTAPISDMVVGTSSDSSTVERSGDDQDSETTQPTTAIGPTPDPCSYVLSEPGPYNVGKLTLEFEDPSREGRPVGIRVWYPMDTSREPDFSGAPYPLIISSAKVGNELALYLVKHGFVWAGVTRIDSYLHMNLEMIDQPLDILFALEQMASNPPVELEGLIDAEHVGAIGYSFDGYNALALGGARIDPDQYLSQCPDPDAITQASLEGYSAFSCGPAGEWEVFTAHVSDAIISSQDGLWQPITDPRIRAVIPMAAEGWWLFGEQGLAAVDRPILMIVGTDDGLYTENVAIFDHLGTKDKVLLSFVDQDHMMIYKGYIKSRMAHFAAAFFGVHLQGRDELGDFMSEETIYQCSDVAWGIYDE